MRKIVLASNNEKKVKELKNMLNEHNFEICSLKDENIDIDVVEDGSTFEENALKKASEIYKYLLTNNKANAHTNLPLLSSPLADFILSKSLMLFA